MTANFHEHFVEDSVPPPSERSTGIVFAGVTAIAGVFWRHDPLILSVAATFAAGFLAISFLAPKLLAPLNIAWFKFALLLNKIVSPLVMFVLFAVVIVPFGLAMQLVRDPLRKRRPDDEESCWIELGPEAPQSSMKNQF